MYKMRQASTTNLCFLRLGAPITETSTFCVTEHVTLLQITELFTMAKDKIFEVFLCWTLPSLVPFDAKEMAMVVYPSLKFKITLKHRSCEQNLNRI